MCDGCYYNSAHFNSGFKFLPWWRVSTANGKQRMIKQGTGLAKSSTKRDLDWLHPEFLGMNLLNRFSFVVLHSLYSSSTNDFRSHVPILVVVRIFLATITSINIGILMKINLSSVLGYNLKNLLWVLVLLCSCPSYAAPVDDLIEYLKSLPAEERADTTLVVMDMQEWNLSARNDEEAATLIERFKHLKPGEWGVNRAPFDITIRNVDGVLYATDGSPETHSSIRKLVEFANPNDMPIVNVNMRETQDEAFGKVVLEDYLLRKRCEEGGLSEFEYEQQYLKKEGRFLGTPSDIIPDEVRRTRMYKFSIKYTRDAFSILKSDLLERSDTSGYIITGCRSDSCVLNSAKGALQKGKKILVSSDTVVPKLGKGAVLIGGEEMVRRGEGLTNWNKEFKDEIDSGELKIFGDTEAFSSQGACARP